MIARLTGLATSLALSRMVGSVMASRARAGGSVRFSAGVTGFGGMDEVGISALAADGAAAAAGLVVSGADILLVYTLVGRTLLVLLVEM